jgi:hypothetical protein
MVGMNESIAEIVVFVVFVAIAAAFSAAAMLFAVFLDMFLK